MECDVLNRSHTCYAKQLSVLCERLDDAFKNCYIDSLVVEILIDCIYELNRQAINTENHA